VLQLGTTYLVAQSHKISAASDRNLLFFMIFGLTTWELCRTEQFHLSFRNWCWHIWIPSCMLSCRTFIVWGLLNKHVALLNFDSCQLILHNTYTLASHKNALGIW